MDSWLWWFKIIVIIFLVIVFVRIFLNINDGFTELEKIIKRDLAERERKHESQK